VLAERLLVRGDTVTSLQQRKFRLSLMLLSQQGPQNRAGWQGVQARNRLPREAVQSLSSAVFKARLEKALSNLS